MQFKRYSLRAVSLLATLLLAVHMAWAAEPFKIRDIQVEGLQRVEPGTVFASMPLRLGDTYNDEKGTASIRALFALGLFTDVRLEIKGDVVVVVVEERPSVAGVEFIGTREFDKDALTKEGVEQVLNELQEIIAKLTAAKKKREVLPRRLIAERARLEAEHERMVGV